MKIFKCKKLIVTTSLIALFLATAHQPLPAAKDRHGSTVEVTMADGRIVKGELLAVKTDALLIYDPDAGQGRSLDLQQVVQVNILNKTKFGEGLLIGLGVTLGISALSWVTSRGHDRENALLYLVLLGPQTALAGGLIGALAGIDKKFSMDGVSSYEMQQNLERLKRYAREQDLERPTEPPHPVP